jgi:hypothetical protein
MTMTSSNDGSWEQLAIQHYINTVVLAVKTFQDHQQQQQRMLAILQLCIEFDIQTDATLCTVEALNLFDGMLLLHSKNWHGGSSPGRQPNIERGRVEAYHRLMEDYFATEPTYNAEKFRRRFRMRRHLVLRVVDAVVEVDDYFAFKKDATGKPGAQPLQKVTAALRMLAYGAAADQLDEWIRLGKSTILECL